MKLLRLFGWITTFGCAVTVFVNLHAQKLPQGKYHQIRERKIDIVHYNAQLGFDFNKKAVMGKAFVTLRPLTSLQNFSLDAIRLQIDKVALAVSGESSNVGFHHRNDSLQINLNKMYSPKDTVTIVISYSAQPNAGMYFQKDRQHKDQYYVYTYGEGGLHANWLPIYGGENDKFTSEMRITVPQPYTVISNGELIATKTRQNNNRMFHWRQELPHSNYLIALYIGEFEKGELSPAFGNIPINYWVPPGKLKEGEYAFRNTTKMVEFFSKRFDYTYPWHKYDQIAVPDFAVGAMEHTSVTGHRASVLRDESAPVNFGPPDFERYFTVWTADNIISHELAHHWFGDNITYRSLNYLWLSESFATYSQMLWDEEFLGRESFHMIRREALDRYFQYVKQNHVIRPLEYSRYDAVGEIYAIPITYFKGALILHMLRNILGDEGFFHSLSYFLDKHEFSNVITMDFKIAIQEATGKNLNWFFKDWVTGGGYPIFQVDYSYLKKRKHIDLNVKQIQPIIKGQDLFTVPVKITIATSKGIKNETIWVKDGQNLFLLKCDEEPLMVSFDGDGDLVAKIKFQKSLNHLIYQIKNDALPGQIRTLRQIAKRFPNHPKTVQTLSTILSGASFWGVQAESALLLGNIRTPEAEKVVQKALESDDYRIRKAAVLGLPKFEINFAEKIIRKAIQHDPHSDVVATAIIALAKVSPSKNLDFIREQLNRLAWYNEITLACLNAFEIIGDKGLVSDIQPFSADKYHEFIQNAALSAWKSCSPTDPDLHKVLMKKAEHGIYGVRFHAIDLLSSLFVEEAIPILEKIARNSGDIDFRVAARNALENIKRISNE